MKAAKRFKRLVSRKRPELMEGILGRASRFVQPPQTLDLPHRLHKSQSLDADDRAPIERVLTSEGVHREIPELDPAPKPSHAAKPVNPRSADAAKESRHGSQHLAPRTPKFSHSGSSTDSETRGKGQAHNPLEDTLFLDIGVGQDGAPLPDVHIVSESPGAVDMNVYEAAYQEEIQRILAAKGKRPTLYLTRRVEGNKTIAANEHIIGHSHDGPETPKLGFARVLDKAREQARSKKAEGQEDSSADQGEQT